MNKKHIIKYGTHKDRRYLTLNELSNHYNMLALNASTIAYAENGMSLFLSDDVMDKSFFVDPMTHAFQHRLSYLSVNNSKYIKKSIGKLINIYGITDEIAEETNNGLIGKKPLTPDYFNNSEKTETFIKNVINFQMDVIKDENKKELKSYLEFAEAEKTIEKSEIRLSVDFLISPYFYLYYDSNIENSHRLETNLKFINKSIFFKEQENISKPLFGEIVLDKKFFEKSDEKFKYIAEEYSKLDVDGYLIWIDDFVENKQISESLNNYLKFLEILKGTGKKIYNLYGGYFSILLTNNDINLLDGVAHGFCYGEHRAVVPVGGGLPRTKYYLEKIHKRVPIKEMLDFLNNYGIKDYRDYTTKLCNCDLVCKKFGKEENFIFEFYSTFGDTVETTSKRGEKFVTSSYSSPIAQDNCIKHYLDVKQKEFDFVKNNNIELILKDLKKNYEEYFNFFNGDISYLKEWHDVLLKYMR